MRDTTTGLEWVAGPDRNTTWYEAKQWVANLTVAGGGWQMPTVSELETLYEKGTGTRNRTPLLKITGWYAWSGEVRDSSQAWGFHFDYGDRRPDYFRPINQRGPRAIAVRSRR